MSEPQIHLVVGTPCYGGILTGDFFTSTLRLQEACMKAGIQVSFLMPSGDAVIPRARQNIVTYFMSQPTATHLLFIDADISFDPDQVFRLLHFKEDVTAALYPLKRYDWERAKATALQGGDMEAGSLSYICEWAKPGVVRDNFAKAKYVGNGFLMIRRAALEKMMFSYPQLRYTAQNGSDDPFAGSPYRYAFFNCILDEETKSYLPEDYNFCKRWVDIGGDIWVDQRSRLTHTGPIAFKGDMSRRTGLSVARVRAAQTPPPSAKPKTKPPKYKRR